MPCIFLENVPEDIEWDSSYLKIFHRRVSEIVNGNVEVHIRRNIRYTLLTPDGEIDGSDHGVHAWVHWHSGRTEDQRLLFGCEIESLLKLHNISQGLDITFVDGEKGETFYFNGDMIM